MARRRGLLILLSILGLFLLGTVIVLSSITYYLSIDPSAYLTELEVPYNGEARSNSSDERIPRIIHQTWKTETLPERWKGISQGCRDMMPDYEYMLWSDAGSRDFIAEHYPWFLETFDGYTYNIQRADAIRYFVLYHYGGVYIDLDIGCKRPVDELLTSSVILPKTIPVGVSNDLMFAEKNHPFLAQTIHNLITFDHSWILNYPTVMFSTGPMFLSIQYALFGSSGLEIRILPKSLYGKNAKEGEAPHTFFAHYYGSSWHADDAAFIGFLGHWGKILMWIGLAVLIVGGVRMMLPAGGKSRRYMSRYTILMPWLTQRRNGSWSLRWSPSDHSPEISDSSESDSPVDDDDILLPFNARPSSPSSTSSMEFHSSSSSGVRDMALRVRNRLASLVGMHGYDALPRTPVRSRRRRSHGVLFFLPTISPEPPLPSAAPQYESWLPEKQGTSGNLEQPEYFASDEDNIESAPHSPLLGAHQPNSRT